MSGRCQISCFERIAAPVAQEVYTGFAKASSVALGISLCRNLNAGQYPNTHSKGRSRSFGELPVRATPPFPEAKDDAASIRFRRRLEAESAPGAPV